MQRSPTFEAIIGRGTNFHGRPGPARAEGFAENGRAHAATDGGAVGMQWARVNDILCGANERRGTSKCAWTPRTRPTRARKDVADLLFTRAGNRPRCPANDGAGATVLKTRSGPAAGSAPAGETRRRRRRRERRAQGYSAGGGRAHAGRPPECTSARAQASAGDLQAGFHPAPRLRRPPAPRPEWPRQGRGLRRPRGPRQRAPAGREGPGESPHPSPRAA